MGSNHVPTDQNVDSEQTATDSHEQSVSTASSTPVTIAATKSDPAGDTDQPNTLTIIGHGHPSSFELTVDGDIQLCTDHTEAETTIISGTTVEGTVETGSIHFQFTGELTDVTFVDQGITGVSPATAPNVHLDYSAPTESRS